MGGLEVGYAGAALAGLLSFLSPCVLPLVPPYLCFLAGVSMEHLRGGGEAPPGVGLRVFLHALAFVLGFATVFVALGASASAVGRLVADHLDVLAKVAGVLIVLLGLHFLGVFRVAALYRELRFHSAARPAGLAGAYVIGLAFAFGWTPCVGPVLAAILFVAAAEDSVWQGAGLLGVYALGIGVPFLLAALLARPFLAFMQRFRRHLHRVEQAMGAFLVITGVLFITGSVNAIGFWLLETFPALGRVG
jgi:cytochrome c-type biogenesis protein